MNQIKKEFPKGIEYLDPIKQLERDADASQGLRPAHFKQLHFYIKYVQVDGVYCGNKEQFLKREQELLSWIETILKSRNNDQF